MTKSGTALLKRGDLEAAEKWLLEALAMRRTRRMELTGKQLNCSAHSRIFATGSGILVRLNAWRASPSRSGGDCSRMIRPWPEPSTFLPTRATSSAICRTQSSVFREALAILRRNESSDPGTLQWSLYALAETLDRQNRFAEAEPLYRELLARPDASKSIDDSVLSPAVGSTRCLTELAWLEQQLGKNTHAVAIRARSREYSPGRTRDATATNRKPLMAVGRDEESPRRMSRR
jgi:tetratricopeptide (TPR) repeat protein